jgi:hypothetical protein
LRDREINEAGEEGGSMDTLVCYYSRSGHSKAYATRIAKELDANLREIVEVQRRFLGPLGLLKAGYDSQKENKRSIHLSGLTLLDPYTKVIVVSPVWAGNVPPAVRAFAFTYKIRTDNLYLLINHRSSDPEAFLPKFQTVFPNTKKMTVITRQRDSVEVAEEKVQSVLEQVRLC